ncbi:MAG: hypothetical protein ABSD56_04765, partial [Bryobacteraceae bacterium]
MLTQADIDQMAEIATELEGQDQRRRYHAWREVLHLYEDVVTRTGKDGPVSECKEFTALRQMARQAFAALG